MNELHALHDGCPAIDTTQAIAHTPSSPELAAHALDAHLRGVATLAASNGLPMGLAGWSRQAGAWHDLGKFREQFQGYLRGEVKKGDRTSHKLAGAAWALEHLAKHPASMPIALSIAGHHGGIPAWSSASGGLQQRLFEARQELAEARAGGAESFLAGDPGPVDPALDAVMHGLPHDDRKLCLEILVRMVFSALVDADWSDTAAYHDGSTALPVDVPTCLPRWFDSPAGRCPDRVAYYRQAV